jgi:UDP-N-acetylmuramyl-tripeptide synthetase
VKLLYLLHGTSIECPAGLEETEVTGVTYNSQMVKKGNLFVCIKGYHTDGHEYAVDAAFRGASVIVSEEELDIKSVPVIKVENSRRFLSKISANYFENPEKRFRLYGVTGTNGKTTVTYMLKNMIEAAGRPCGILGTISYRYGSKEYESVNTTPESYELQKMFAEMKSEGIEDCVMEVSSHALAMGRVEDITFDGAIFTNLTSDHMDFHKNAEEYFEAKKKLFSLCRGTSTVNIDDEYGKRLYEDLKSQGKEVTGYSLKDKKADYFAEIIETTEKGSTIRITENTKNNEILKINTPGIFMIYNGMAALACARSAGLSFLAIQRGMAALKGVPGRFELVENEKGYLIIVDYAHTPDALEKVLKTAIDFKKGRLICIFGCGGDRDKKKRAFMGSIAGKYSDYCIITSDNPRTEKQENITADIEAGIYETGCNYEVIEKRYDAIKKAVSIYKKGDIILIAGKGHETYQIIGTEKYHFDDKEAVKNIIENGE